MDGPPLLCYWLLDDPEYLKKEQSELMKRPYHFEPIGPGLLSIAMNAWEIGLAKAQEWDWLDDPTWRFQTLLSCVHLASALRKASMPA